MSEAVGAMAALLLRDSERFREVPRDSEGSGRGLAAGGSFCYLFTVI